jgi:hypothetical protein
MTANSAAKRSNRTPRQNTTDVDDNGMYKTVVREMRTLHNAVENTASGKWVAIKRAASSSRFEVKK